MKIRVLIAEDQRLLRQCFVEALQLDSDIEVVGEAADGQEAVMLAEQLKPDIVLMDLAMPHMDGIKATAILHERTPSIKVLILSSYHTPAQVGKAIKTGIAGYIQKDVDLHELIKIIKATQKGVQIQSPFLADQKLYEHRNKSYNLSDRELSVLKLLVTGCNNSEIAASLCVSEQTIKKELVSLFEKLKVKNRTQAAVKGVELGFAEAEIEELEDNEQPFLNES